MMGTRSLRLALAVAATLALALPAFAQDYTVTNTSGKYVGIPTSGVTTTSITGDDAAGSVSMPFSFSYFGRQYNSFSACTNGFIQFGGGADRTYLNTTLPQNGTNNGVVCPMWDDLYVGGGNAAIRHWSDGTAPNRRFIVTWDRIRHLSYAGPITFQVQLYETTGKIVFAYTTGTWQVSSFTVGIDEPGGSNRYVYPNGYTGNGNRTVPPSLPDFEFVPRETVFTGSVRLDALVTDASGIGGQVVEDVIPAGLVVQLRDGGNVAAQGLVDTDGSFDVRGLALVGSTTGSLHLAAESLGSHVSPSTALTQIVASSTVELANSVSFGTTRNFGTITVDDTLDSGGDGRAALQIAMQMEALRAFAVARTSDPLTQIYVFFDPNSTAGTSFTAGAAGPPVGPATIRIGGSGSANDDSRDPWVISRVYARHVLASINADLSGAFTSSVDVQSSSEELAFADGFGSYLYAMTSGQSVGYDGRSASLSNSFDLEDVNLSSSPDSRTSGWVGAALYDLIDAANESHDDVNGTTGSDADRPFTVIDTLTSSPNPSNFVDEWDNQGFDAEGLVRDFVHHGLLGDDSNEPNDTAGEAAQMGSAGLIRQGLSLNRFNEDWYEITLPEATDAFFADVTYNRGATGAEILLEIRSIGGALLGTGVASGSVGPYEAATGPLTAGPVLVRVAHTAGGRIDDYTLQAYSRLRIVASDQGAWTVKRPIAQDLGVSGGIGPYTLAVKQPTVLPSGMILDSQNVRLTGSPQDVGEFTFQILCTDSGTPANSTTLTQTYTINPALAFSAPALTGVAVGKLADVDLGRTGGTTPIVVLDLQGNLPPGLAITSDFHIQGTANDAGGGDIHIEAIDIAGSAATVDTTVIACNPFNNGTGEAGLASGEGAAGFYFDALAGSSANLSLKTAKKQAKRNFDVLLVAPDGNVVQGGKVKVKAGSASLKGVPLPKTGRYFLMFSSDDGGPASELAGKVSTKLPKKGSGVAEQLEFQNQVLVEFGALQGANFKLTGKTTNGMNMRMLFIIQPDGGVVPFESVTQVQKGSKYSLEFTATQSGTYALYMTPKPGEVGDFKFKYKLKQPKGGVFVSAEE